MTEREIGLILAKLDALHEDIIELKTIHDGLDNRIDSLERFRAWASGAGALCVTIGGLTLTHIISIFK